MEPPALPNSVPEVEALILSLYQPNPPEVIARTQSILSRLQGSPRAWAMARDLMARPDKEVKFFGALTIIVKLNNESSSLSDEDAIELLLNLIGWYMEILNSPEPSGLVARKLSSALATFFLRFHGIWRQCVRHIVLCFLSGQPCHPDVVDKSPDTSALTPNLQPHYTRAILWALNNILEDVNKYDLNSANNMGLYDAVLDNTTDSISLLGQALSQSMPRQVREDAIKCLQSWLWFAQRSSTRDNGLARNLGPLVTNVISCLTDDQLWDASAELITEVLSNYSTFFTEEHLKALAHLFESEWFYQRYQGLIQGDFDFDSVRIGQLLLAFGDAKVEQLMQANDSQSRNLLSQLCGLIAANGYPVAEDKIFVPALEFWSTFSETMTDSMYSDEGSADTWASNALSYVLQAVANAWPRIAYPPSDEFSSWDSNERVGFSDARKDVVDLLQSVYTLAGPMLVSTFAELTLEALSTSSWARLEAAAFCLGGLADCTGDDTRSDDSLTSVFSSSLFSVLQPGQANIPSRVRQTCVSLIEHHTEYFERNMSHLPPALNLLFAVVGDQHMSSPAAKSIYRLCSSCRGHLHPEVGAFLDEYHKLVDSYKLDCVASEKVLGGIASVAQAIPDSGQRYAAIDRLLNFIEYDVERSMKLLQSPEAIQVPCFSGHSCSYASPEEHPALHVALRSLRCLASVGKGLQAPSDTALDLEGSTKPVEPDAQLSRLQERVLEVVVQVQKTFNTTGEVTEIICSVLRSGFSETEPGPFVLPPEVVTRYLTQHVLTTPRIGLLVYTACSFVSSLEHDRLQSQNEVLSAVLLWVMGLLRELPSPETDPELAQNGIDFVCRLLSRHPAIFVRIQPQNVAEFFFLFTLQVLDGKEPLPKASAAEFWAAFVGLKNDDPAIEESIGQAMNTLGPLLAQTLARNIGGNASRSELDKLSEPLKKLVNRYPMTKNWLEAGLNDQSFPSTKVTAGDKSMFVKKIIGLRGARTTNQVVREFWLSARGSSFAYAS